MTHLPRRNAGFTLIELLAVMLILAILVTFLMRSGIGGIRAVETGNTKAFLQEVTGLVNEYEGEFGAYPPSSFDPELDEKPSKANEGIESLVITLYRAGRGWQAPEVAEENLGNTDGDSTKKSLTTFSQADAFELLDAWGNPLAYIHRRDYDRKFTYVTWSVEDGEIEREVQALVSPKTGDPYRRRSFQLLSAGQDGEFGTGDDLANFEIER